MSDETKGGRMQGVGGKRLCAACGKTYTVRKFWQKFCSPKCKSKAHYKGGEIQVGSGGKGGKA